MFTIRPFVVKMITLLIIASMFLTACGPEDLNSSGPSASPLPPAATSSQSNTTVQPSQNQAQPQASPIPTPPVKTPTPPQSYEKNGNIEIWSLTNRHISENDVYSASAIGLVLVAADGPLPVGDVVALVVVGTVATLYAVQMAPEVARQLTYAMEDAWDDLAVMMAKDPGNIVVPPVPQGMPAFPPHIMDGNHPAGPFAARWKQVVWITIFTLFMNGNKPDWCGKRADGGIMIVYYSAQIFTKIGGKVYTGLALLINQGGAHQSTAFKDVIQKSDGSGAPDTGNSSGNDGDQFIPFPCPDFKDLKPITQ